MASAMGTTGAYILHDGVDGLDGFPLIDRIAYRFDDDADTLVIRVEITAASAIERIYPLPLYNGLEPSDVVPTEQNPFAGIAWGGGVGHSPIFPEVEPGVREYTLNLDGKKAYLNDSYSLRIVLVEGTATQIVFQDFSPTP